MKVANSFILTCLSGLIGAADAEGAETSTETAANNEPRTVRSSIRVVAPDIVKISWVSQPGKSYAIERVFRLSDPWEQFSVEEARESVTRRSVYMVKPKAFFRVRELDTAVRPEATNLVRNPNFVDRVNDLPVGWHKGGYGSNTRIHTYPVAGYGGGSAARVEVSGYVNGDAKWYFDEVPVSPNTTLLWSDRYLASVRHIVTAQFHLSNGSYSYRDIAYPDMASSWQPASAQFTTPSNCIAVTVFHSLISNGSLTIDSVSLHKVSQEELPLSEGMVSLDFDDAWRDTALTVSTMLEAANLRGTFYIPCSSVGKPGYVSRDDLLSLEMRGHEIGSHTVNHLDLTTLPEDWAEWEVNICRHNLLSSGVRQITSFAYPFGAYNDAAKRIVSESGHTIGRIIGTGLNQRGATDLSVIDAISVRQGTTLERVWSLIDQARTEKKWLVLVFHRVDQSATEYSKPPQFLRDVVNYLNANNVKVVTARQGHAIMTSP